MLCLLYSLHAQIPDVKYEYDSTKHEYRCYVYKETIPAIIRSNGAPVIPLLVNTSLEDPTKRIPIDTVSTGERISFLKNIIPVIEKEYRIDYIQAGAKISSSESFWAFDNRTTWTYYLLALGMFLVFGGIVKSISKTLNTRLIPVIVGLVGLLVVVGISVTYEVPQMAKLFIGVVYLAPYCLGWWLTGLESKTKRAERVRFARYENNLGESAPIVTNPKKK